MKKVMCHNKVNIDYYPNPKLCNNYTWSISGGGVGVGRGRERERERENVCVLIAVHKRVKNPHFP